MEKSRLDHDRARHWTAEHPQLFHVRTGFATGSVVEDPATGEPLLCVLGVPCAPLGWPHVGCLNHRAVRRYGICDRFPSEISRHCRQFNNGIRGWARIMSDA